MNKIGFFLCVALITVSIVNAQKAEVYSPAGRAINGYDPVAYFSEGKPVKGNEKISYRWNSATWYFSNKQNLDSFTMNPQKFAPQYGGYCAYGMSQGHKAPTEADAWTIENGKLYLNYNKNVKQMWSKDRPGYIQLADKNWVEIKDKE
jgi:YHS domain-containing protein